MKNLRGSKQAKKLEEDILDLITLLASKM